MPITSGSLWRYHEDEPNDNVANFELFKFKKITGETPAGANTKKFEIVVPLKRCTNF